MKPLSGSNDRIGNLIREAGLETPPGGISERIMHRIEATALKRVPNLRPVITVRGWIWIGTAAIVLIFLLIFSGIIVNSNSNPLWNANSVFHSFPHFNTSLHLNLQIPKSLLFGLTVLLVWFGLDFLLGTLKWKRPTARGKS
jgi:hypothetical protein